MAIIKKSEKNIPLNPQSISDLSKKIYDDDEIKNFELDEAIDEHPLSHRPTMIRSKLAYRELMQNAKKTTKYMLPGNMYMFFYHDPKYAVELEYYDRTPLILSLGITRTKDNVIREVGMNLHFYPPFARERILNHTYQVFKPWFDKQFNDPQHKVSHFISYERLKHLMNRNMKLAFGIRMYIPILRGATYQLPTRLLPVAYYTEGHFSKATMVQIFRFWRQFR